MAFENLGKSYSFAAHIDFSLKQYYAVTFKSTNDVDVATAAKAIMGIIQNNPASGKTAQVCRDGISKAKITASQNIAIGDLLEVDTGGTLKILAAGYPVAQAMEATNSAAICTISVMLLPSNALFA